MITRFDNLVLYDGHGGKMDDTSLLISGGLIVDYGSEIKASYADNVIDGRGLCVTPGWFQSHTHIALDGEPNMQEQIRRENNEATVMASAIRNGYRCLKAGLTSVRDMGTAYDVSIKYRDCIKAGKILGPTVYASGRVICMTGGHGSDFGIEVDGADEARKAARQLIKNGADHLKIMATGGGQSKGMKAGVPQLNFEEIKAIAEEAQHCGTYSAAHAQGKEGVMNCLHAGVECIEHGVTLDDEQIELMIKNGTYFSPTLLGLWYCIEKGEENGIPSYVVEKCKKQGETHFSGFQAAYKAGVKIIAGTDAGTPFNYQDDFSSELKLMAHFGMPVRDVISAATGNCAAACMVDQKVGKIKKGLLADLTFMEGDPEKDINAFDRIRMVYKAGQKVYCREGKADWFMPVV